TAVPAARGSPPRSHQRLDLRKRTHSRDHSHTATARSVGAHQHAHHQPPPAPGPITVPPAVRQEASFSKAEADGPEQLPPPMLSSERGASCTVTGDCAASDRLLGGCGPHPWPAQCSAHPCPP